MEETKKCPYCAEEIKKVAIKCKHCGMNLVENNIEVTTTENIKTNKEKMTDKTIKDKV